MVDYWLGQCYHHLVVKGDGTEVINIFKKRLEADHSLKEKAHQKLSELNATNRNAQIAGGNRCFVSRKYSEILQSVLN